MNSTAQSQKTRAVSLNAQARAPANRSARRRVARIQPVTLCSTPATTRRNVAPSTEFGCDIIDNDGNGVSDGWVSFDTHCGCGCVDPAVVDIQCRAGEFRCNDNTCIIMDWVCDDQAADCAGGEDEDPNNCPQCREDADCAAGEVCDPVTFECGAPPPCNGDGDCAEGEVCDPATNQCVDAGGGACQGDADCPAGQQCNLQTNVCEDQGGCANDGDCAIDEQCDIASGQCVARCNGNADCGAGEICDLNSGICQPEPAGCDADEFECGDGSCIQLAWRCDGWDFDCPGNDDETCPEGQVCDAGTNSCVDAPVNCAQDRDCGDLQRCDLNSQQCIDVECVQDADCNRGQVCNPDNNTCVEDQPNGCANDAECNGQQCVDAVCQVCDPADNAGCDDPLKVSVGRMGLSVLVVRTMGTARSAKFVFKTSVATKMKCASPMRTVQRVSCVTTTNVSPAVPMRMTLSMKV